MTTHSEKLAKLRAETARLRTLNDKSVADARAAVDAAERALDESEGKPPREP